MTPEERARLIWESTDLECEHNRMTVEQLADEIRAAVATEREACAKLAEQEHACTCTGLSIRCEGCVQTAGGLFAAATIRARSSYDT